MKDVLAWIDGAREKSVGELQEWVRIPSISSDARHKADLEKNADWLIAKLKTLGADRVEKWPTAGHPAVFASYMHQPGKPTLLVYGHHDVQPIEPLAEWKSPPFEPAIREGRMWGRGVVDDKGQV
ncbi:MAG TPA: M20/M25/M40 family metallo-hydrolase, partial [Polyangiaceae bacterium]|nr:M20/M25/M40 family metallo-hydrolase [Polyangiaceae bacterium]